MTSNVQNGLLATAAGYSGGCLGFTLGERFKEDKESQRLWEIARSTFPSQNIPTCEAKNEEEFETWIDKIAQIFAIHGYKMGREFIIDRIVASLNSYQLDTVRDHIIERDMPVEQFINKIARALYPDSPYIRHCYKTLDDFNYEDMQVYQVTTTSYSRKMNLLNLQI